MGAAVAPALMCTRLLLQWLQQCKENLVDASSTSSSYTSANTACKKQQAVSKQQPNFVLKHTSATQKGHAFEPERVAVWQSAGESIRT